jgi:hypothetical protein
MGSIKLTYYGGIIKMSLVSLAKKASYGTEIENLNTQIWNHIYDMAKVFTRFDEITSEVKENVDFTDEDKDEITSYMMDCYRRLMMASLGAHNIPGVGGVPIELWDEVGLDIRPILAAVGKYVYSSASSRSSSSSSSSSGA